jgi:hypothetical protein
MECELCYQAYAPEPTTSHPKVLKACSHSYCQSCIIKLKEKTGKAQCPVCLDQQQ